MAQEVGGIYSRLSVDATSFDNGLSKAGSRLEQETRRFGTQFSKIAGGVGVVGKSLGGLTSGMLAGAAGLLSFHAVASKARAALQEFGDIADRAAATGFDAELLQALEHQAGLAGIKVDALADALTAFTKNAGLAANGQGKMVGALKELNPELLESIRHATTQEQRIRLVIDALAKEADQAKKAAMASAIFGEQGSKIAAAFAEGSGQIDVILSKAKELGVVGRDVVARADDLGDELDTITKRVGTDLNRAFVELGPVLIWITGRVADMASTVGFMIDGMKGLEQQSTATIEAQLNALNAASNMPNPMGLPTDIFGVDAAKKKELTDELRRRAIDNLRDQLTNPIPKTADTPTLDEIKTRDDAAKAAIKQAEAVKTLIADLEFEQSLIGKTDTEIKIATELRKAGASATDAQRTAITGLITSIDEQNAALERTKAQFDEIKDTAKSFLTTFISGLKGGKSAIESLGDALGNLADRLMDQPIAGPFHNFHN